MEEPKAGKKRDRNAEWLTQFEGQMLVSGLLAKALYGMPDRDWIAGIAARPMFGEIPFGVDRPEIATAASLLGAWARGFAAGRDETGFDAIRDDYNRLFVGPHQLLAAPWESVYSNKDRAVFQRETVSVRNWYLRFDLVLASAHNEPADHVGLQFGFLAHLAELTLSAAALSDGREVTRLIDAQRGFLAQHMLPWVPRWADDVVANARTDFHRGLGWLARGAVLEAASFVAATTAERKQQGAFRKDN